MRFKLGASICLFLSATVGALSAPNDVPSFPTVAILKAIPVAAAKSYPTVQVQGYYAAGDFGLAETFVWTAGSSASGNDCTIINPTGNGGNGRWLLNIPPQLDVRACGAKHDNSTNDYLAIQTAINVMSALHGSVIIPKQSACYKLENTMVIPSNGDVRGAGYPCLSFTSGASAGEIEYTGSNGRVDGLAVTSGGAQGVFLGCGTGTCKNMYFTNNIYTRASTSGSIMGMYDTGPTWTNIVISGNVLTGGSYGILMNGDPMTRTGMTGSSLYISDNFISSVDADAIEINTVSDNWTGVTIANNLLSSAAATALPQAGFCIGVAAGHQVTITGNVCYGSANHAVHIEDNSHDIVISGNSISGVASGKVGIDILRNTASAVTTITVANNTITAGSAGTGIGIDYESNVAGFATNTVTSGNVINLFGTGIWAIGPDPVVGNRIYAATLGMFSVQAGTRSISDNTFDTVTTVYSANDGGQFGQTNIVGTLPTALITNVAGASSIRGISVQSSYSHPGSGAALTTVLPTPGRYTGEWEVHAESTATAVNHTDGAGNSTWDGSSFANISGTTVSQNGGGSTLTAAALAINGTGVQITTTSSPALTVNYQLNLDGYYIK